MKKPKLKKIKGLGQFKYCDVSDSFELTVSSDLDYFKNQIHRKKHWRSKVIDLATTNYTATFDSGIVCATSDELPLETDVLMKLNCFFAPYKLMQDTIGTIKKPCKKNDNPNTDNLGIGFGIVLSIIATKGSAETGNRKPYILFVKRGNLPIRGNQMDVPVVEGLNCGDFKKAKNGKYNANLSEIAKRALVEERGLNVDFLISNGLLHMPKKYYFGYDSSYCQWNFFGTVVIDCTVEEIIREGCYYTKDKFETKEIIGIPAEPKVLYYYLSSNMIPIHNRMPEKEKTEMWTTAWASVIFAVRDYYDKKLFKLTERKCLHRKNYRMIYNGHIRDLLNELASVSVHHRHSFEIACLFFAFILVGMFVIPFLCQMFQKGACNISISNCIERVISIITTFLSAWLTVAVVRYDIVNGKDNVKLNTYWREDDEQSLFPEIFVFRNVVLRDGNIGEKLGNVHFHYQHTRNLCGTITPQRKCQMSHTQEDGVNTWGMEDFTKENFEDFSWEIKCCNDTKNSVRIVAPLITQKRNIIFKYNNSYQSKSISHYVDLEIPYTDFVGKSNKDIQKMITKRIIKFVDHKSHPIIKISFKLLLEYRGQSVIVAFLESNSPSSNARPLTYDLTETTYSQNMKDDLTRVVCEYAIAEYIGYKMSSR